MMGTSHAISGAAAWIAITGAVPILSSGAAPLDPVGVLAGAVVCAGAALLPDADHHRATVAQAVPVLGRVATGLIGTLSGGHRHGAHSPIGVAVATLLAWLLSLVIVPVGGIGDIAVGAAAGTAALTCFAVKARDLVRTWPAAWLAGGALALVIVVVVPEQLAWFPGAVAVGYVAHLAGDVLTTGGLPGLWWPWVPRPPAILADLPVLGRIWQVNGYVALPILGDTGSWREKAFAGLLALYVTIAAGYEVLRAMGIDPLALV
ncbi:metal-dependent hydrolase [Agromyces sp. G08B096]|uniref:Metal-dependent hydrolase n=1 Tax=Agromyces sp. G08B096 TaxID=3156399 RepID=A0AAU7WDB2_9MICO